MFVMFLTKHRHTYPISADIFYNKRTWLGVASGLSFAAIVVYVPGIQMILSTAPVSPLALLAPIATGLLLTIYEYGRKFLRNRGFFGGVPKRNPNLLELVRTTSTVSKRVKI